MGNSADIRLMQRDEGFSNSAVVFPRFLMKINGKLRFMPMEAAAAELSNFANKVASLGLVLENADDYDVRPITQEESNEMIRIADASSIAQ